VTAGKAIVLKTFPDGDDASSDPRVLTQICLGQNQEAEARQQVVG
jgi:hypothetical protein